MLTERRGRQEEKIKRKGIILILLERVREHLIEYGLNSDELEDCFKINNLNINVKLNIHFLISERFLELIR